MSDASRVPTLRLKVFRGDALLEERAFSEPSISIGRATSAVLVVDDATLGDLHAVINVEDDGKVQLLDLGTEAGTLVDGKAVSNAVLSPGDSFTMGEVKVFVFFDDAEHTTPTVDVRPEPGATVAGGADDGALVERAEDIMALVMRSGTGSGTTGIDTKSPKVLEINQIWQNVLLDTKHFARGREVTVGDAVGFTWSLLGIPLGWVPGKMAPVLRLSPPIWSDVRSDWRNDFYASDDALPSGQEYRLFSVQGNDHVARIYEKWEAFADIGEQRYTLDQLVTAGKAKKVGEFYEVPVSSDLRLVIDIEGVVFFCHLVQPGAKVVTAIKDSIDYPFLAVFLFVAALGGLFGVLMATAPPPPENDLVELPEQFVELLLERPEPEKKEAKKPDGNKDAGEGAKAKKEEGKVGKKEAKMEKAKGNKREVAQTQRDREIAENAGVLGALSDAGGMDGVFGSSGLDASLAGGIGGLVGAKGVQIGSGGLGSRGSGLGGGGTAEGLGGLGTKGTGSGSSGYGSGGGSFGSKGSGGLASVSGDPIIMGALDRSLIDAVIKRKMSQIRYCYQRELQKDPSLAGKLVVKFTIANNGSVSAASVKESSVGSPAVDSCVIGRFRQMVFPEPKGGGIVIVSYPFIFSPG